MVVAFHIRILGLLFGLLGLSGFIFGQHSAPQTLLFVGSYTDGEPGNGIRVFGFDPETGSLRSMGKVRKIVNPSFLTVSPDGKFLFACTETKMPSEGGVTSFAIDSIHGGLQRISRQPSGGANPVYVSVHPEGKWIAVANYSEGTIAAFPVNEKGEIGPYSQRIQFSDSSVYKLRQEKSHPHAAVFSPDGRFLFVPDLGADKIRMFAFSAAGSLPLKENAEGTIKSFPAAGPRHLTFHPNGNFAYCIEELSGRITAYRYQNGRLDSIQSVFANSKQREIYSSADIHLSPDGRFLYASNRGENENTLAIFSVESVTGGLTFVAYSSTLGDHPRNFCISPDGGFLIVANQVTGNLVVFRRDSNTGMLTTVGKDIRMKNPSSLWMRTYGSLQE
ncbi:MAG: lactonase family protein [Bacteroidetes bacterium]|nr:lactonase family protein [Bacteroidota bacterium]